MKAVIYSRVSTDQQSTENQTNALQTWAQQRAFTVVKTYCEADSAWKSGHQKELARLVKDAYLRKFDVILVWALDRLSREGALAILNLTHKLSSYGVKVLSYQ